MAPSYHVTFRLDSAQGIANDLTVQADVVPPGGFFEYAIMKGVQDPIYLTYGNSAVFSDIGSERATPHYVSYQRRLDSVQVEFMPPGPNWK